MFNEGQFLFFVNLVINRNYSFEGAFKINNVPLKEPRKETLLFNYKAIKINQTIEVRKG